MLGPKQGMGRRFFIPTNSNHPFYKKNKWEVG